DSSPSSTDFSSNTVFRLGTATEGLKLPQPLPEENDFFSGSAAFTGDGGVGVFGTGASTLGVDIGVGIAFDAAAGAGFTDSGSFFFTSACAVDIPFTPSLMALDKWHIFSRASSI